MFCLRSWIPLLFIPANASPAFIFLFFVCTYFLNRPCVYCSILLLILFITSCYWSDRCFFEFSSNWFAPRITSAAFESWIDSHYSSNGTCTNSTVVTAEPASYSIFNNSAIETLNTTATALAGIAADEVSRKRAEWTGLGIEWLRSILGKREWRIECMDLNIRL
ncbi:putative Bladder cancer-related BC10-like protein [Rosellinia necatrix]|uniref:Putative Bladder cancer-related BC10-like protein n=1 Tax=Rosellinia necatrix TaxID=77044 RepID=A0A1W2TCB3_ROSNE|nr:putative Bladder cancer-related BC10-like protein [Rosellinia necatrix]